MSSFSVPRSSSKKALVHSEPPEKINLPADQPSPNLQALGLAEFMVGPLTDTLKYLKTKMQGIKNKEQLSQVEDRPPSLPDRSHSLWDHLCNCAFRGGAFQLVACCGHQVSSLPGPKLWALCLEPRELLSRSSGTAIRLWSLSKLAVSPNQRTLL
jgi:hypothetical protein